MTKSICHSCRVCCQHDFNRIIVFISYLNVTTIMKSSTCLKTHTHSIHSNTNVMHVNMSCSLTSQVMTSSERPPPPPFTLAGVTRGASGTSTVLLLVWILMDTLKCIHGELLFSSLCGIKHVKTGHLQHRPFLNSTYLKLQGVNVHWMNKLGLLT